VHVLENFWNRELRLAAVHHREHGVAALDIHPAKAEVGSRLAGKPSSRHAENNPTVVGVLFGRQHIHRQRHAELASVDHVLGANDVVGRLRTLWLLRDSRLSKDEQVQTCGRQDSHAASPFDKSSLGK
jgi:hypothetical protein